MKFGLRRSLGGVGVLLLLCVGVALAQTDWPSYGRDPGSSRYSPLTQINLKNVSTLQHAWTFHMTAEMPSSGRAGRGGGRRTETTPIMVGNVLYLPTPYNRVVALNAETGTKIWESVVPGGASAGFVASDGGRACSTSIFSGSTASP